MVMVAKRLYGFVYVCFCTITIASQYTTFAQQDASVPSDAPYGFSQFKITHWTTEDGLPGNTLVSLYQDKKGYLWIGSYQGLIRFDGNKFTDYDDSNTPGLVSHHIRAIVGDSIGNIWLGTGHGLVKYNNGKFLNISDSSYQFFIESISLDEKNNKLWLGTRSSGLYCYHVNENRFEKIESEFSSDIIYAIIFSEDGGIFVGGGKTGLAYYKDGRWTYYGNTNRMLKSEILSMHSYNGALYIGTPMGLIVKEGDRLSWIDKFNEMSVNTIKTDREGNLWILTNRGAFKQEGNQDWKLISTKDGLSDSDVRDVLFGEEGSIWLATYRGGLNQLRETKFMTLTATDGIDTDVIREIEHVKGDLFMAISADEKLYTIQNGVVKHKAIKNQVTKFYDLLIDNENLWIASYSGLLLIKPNGAEKLFTEKDGLPTRQLRIIYKDSKGRYWIGTKNQGLLTMEFKENGVPVFELFKPNEINSSFIMSIREDEMGNLLIGTNTGGINIISPQGDVTIYDKSKGLISNLVFGTHTDNKGVVWVAATDGVSRIEHGQCFNYTGDSGLPQESIFDIVEDELGYLWMSAAIGIIRVEKDQLNKYKDGSLSSVYWKVYGKQDELKKSECTSTASILKAPDGSLWFPMNGGIVAVVPASLTINKTPPAVYLEKIVVDDVDLPPSSHVVISPDSRRIAFHYTALSLKSPKSNLYRYQLVNFDKQWIEAGTERQIVYTNLPRGDYEFKVIACNNDGVWNNTGASITLTVEPYFYETKWFYGLSIAIFGFGVLSFIRWRTQIVRNKNFELEIEVAKRTLQLKQKSDSLEEENREKTSILNIVSHDLRSPLNKIKGLTDLMKLSGGLSTEQNEYVTHIVRSVSDGNQLIRHLLDSESLNNEKQKNIEITPIDLQSFLHGWQMDVNAQLIHKNQKLHIDNRVAENFIFKSEPLLLTRILDNLVSNASKFSEKGQSIWVTVRAIDGAVNFSIRDEGPGISDEDRKLLFRKFQKLTARPTAGEGSTGLGLSITKALIEKLNGTIDLKSKVGEGTEFIVTFPLTAS
jgi:signal transduction histidine kinase